MVRGSQCPVPTPVYSAGAMFAYACLVTFLLAGAALSSRSGSSSSSTDDTVGPVFTREPQNRVDFSNTTGAVVECKARGNPPPEIIWLRSDGTAVGDVPGLRQILANGNLVFPPFRAENYRQEVHAQVYSCLAKNSVGTIHSRDVNVRAGRISICLPFSTWFLRWDLFRVIHVIAGTLQVHCTFKWSTPTGCYFLI